MPATFYSWLCQQTMRTDPVGRLAAFAVKDRIFPRHTRRLHILLLRFEHMPPQRHALKLAHAEWRKIVRRRTLAA